MSILKLNVIDLEKSEYKGGKSSLCPGCGHDQISNVIINRLRDLMEVMIGGILKNFVIILRLWQQHRNLDILFLILLT